MDGLHLLICPHDQISQNIWNLDRWNLNRPLLNPAKNRSHPLCRNPSRTGQPDSIRVKVWQLHLNSFRKDFIALLHKVCLDDCLSQKFEAFHECYWLVPIVCSFEWIHLNPGQRKWKTWTLEVYRQSARACEGDFRRTLHKDKLSSPSLHI